MKDVTDCLAAHTPTGEQPRELIIPAPPRWDPWCRVEKSSWLCSNRCKYFQCYGARGLEGNFYQVVLPQKWMAWRPLPPVPSMFMAFHHTDHKLMAPTPRNHRWTINLATFRSVLNILKALSKLRTASTLNPKAERHGSMRCGVTFWLLTLRDQ